MDPRLDEASKPQPDSDLFAIPLGLRLMLWVCAVFLAVMLGFTLALPWLEPPKPGHRIEVIQVGGGAVFGFFLVLCLWILPQVHDRYRVSPEAITRLRPRRPPATMRWSDVVRIVDRPLNQRLELHGTDIEGRPLVLQLENQLQRADLLRSIVMARTDWTRLIEDPLEPLTLPVTIYKTSAYFVMITFLVLLCGGFSVVYWWAGVWLGALIFLGSAMASLLLLELDWYAVGIDQGSLTLHYPLHRRTIPAESVRSIALGTTRGQHYSAFLTVILHLDTGKRLPLLGTRGGALRLYRALGLAFPRADIS